MSFFEKYNGTSNTRLLRMERLIWPLIYGGLLALVLAWFTERTQGETATGLFVAGAVAIGLGVAVFFWRSRQQDE